jgi:LemA protein
MKRLIGCSFLTLTLVGAVIALGTWSLLSYHLLVREKIEVEAAWSRIENVYQRRFSLSSHLAESARIAAVDDQAAHHLAESCERVSQMILTPEILNDPERLKELQRLDASQAAAVAAVVQSLDPGSTAGAEIMDLDRRLRSTRESLTDEGNRFDRAARRFNRVIGRMPMSWFARLYGFHPVPLIETVAIASPGLADGEGAVE